MSEALLELFVRLIAVMLCWVAALAVWDIGRNSPLRFARELARSQQAAAHLRTGILRFAVGLIAAFVALVVLVETLPFGTSDLFSVYAIGTFCAGFAVDLLVGDALRAIVRGKR
ncbi:MAG TPA: hypothetical protein VIG32_04880 [Candidatus Baltobacteraceae bacterium]|jgi:hypothetical protein